jgi:hypothetical protein
MGNSSDLLESLIMASYIPAMRDKRYEDALTIAIVVYLLSPKEESIADSVGLISDAVSRITEKQGVVTRSCCFCGEKPPKVRLGVGGAGHVVSYICNCCVDLFYDSFHRDPSTK